MKSKILLAIATVCISATSSAAVPVKLDEKMLPTMMLDLKGKYLDIAEVNQALLVEYAGPTGLAASFYVKDFSKLSFIEQYCDVSTLAVAAQQTTIHHFCVVR